MNHAEIEAFQQKHGFRPYIHQFCYFNHRVPWGKRLVPLTNRHGRDYIYIDNSAILVRFTGYVKRHYHRRTGGHVFMRGQPDDYGKMIPSLFRDLAKASIKTLELAHQDLLNELVRAFPNERFRTDELGALLQHYGFKTPWLDLVDNLFMALWFAGRESSATGGLARFAPTGRSGWIFLIGTGRAASSARLRVSDLRVNHSSLTLRPHTQHGLSATLYRTRPWTETSRCLDKYVLAVIEVPADLAAGFTGPLADQQFLFPPPDADHTYELLLTPKAQRIVARVYKRYNLHPGALGNVTRYT